MLLRNPAAEETKEWAGTCKVVKTLIMPIDRINSPDTPMRLGEIYPKLKQYIEKSVFALGDFHQPKAQKLFDRYEAFIAGDMGALTDKTKSVAKSNKPVVTLSVEEQAMIEKIINLEFGTWFELFDSKGKKRLVKLSWLNPVSEHCMFVDQSGVQALMIKTGELARRICSGQGKIIDQVDEQPFVGRALRKISQSLMGFANQHRQASV